MFASTNYRLKVDSNRSVVRRKDLNRANSSRTKTNPPSSSSDGYGRVNKKIKLGKSIRWMPRDFEPKKDVIGCDKPRGAVK
jgi:hypothetical protein